MTFTRDEEIKRKGYNQNPIVTIPKEELVTTFKKLDKLDIARVRYTVHTMKLQDSIYDAKKFLEYYYKLHKVPYIRYLKIGSKIIPIKRQISPFKLPLYGVPTDDIFAGAVIEEITSSNPVKIYFHGINLGETITEQTSASYVHELTHTQLDSIPGSIKEYFNTEVLSVFNELFHASILDNNERMLRLNDSRRLCEMRITAEELLRYNQGRLQLTRETLLDCGKYLESDLKAYNLFITFYNGSDKLKNEILDDIQSVFDGYMTLEELLEKYEISYENSQNEQRLYKYFTR